MDVSIRTKLIGLVGGAALISVLVQLIVFPRGETRLLEESLISKGSAVLRLESAILGPTIEIASLDEARLDLERLLDDPDIRYVVLFRPSGEAALRLGPPALTASVRPPEAGAQIVRVREDEEHLDLGIFVSAGSEGKWPLVIGLDRSGIRGGQLRVWKTALGVGLIVIALGLLMGRLLARGMVDRLARLAQQTEAMAAGDLAPVTFEVGSGDEIGRLARSLGKLAETQRRLVQQLTDTALQLNSAAGEFMATAQQQDRGATEQASAVEETRRTLDALIHSGQTIGDAAQEVLQNAERAQQNSEVVAQHISALSEQVQHITEILEVIKGIANKSELLALNAALEGTKAGEAGRGFSLVAKEMQRLAENVMEAVRDIRDLTSEIREATQASVLATEESTKLAGSTTRSSRQIAMIIQQQQSGTEQVAAAMDDVSKIASQSAASAREIVSSTQDILQLCEHLHSLVSDFRLQGEAEAK